MKVSSSVPTTRYVPQSGSAAIEFADPENGGNSSSAEKHGGQEKSVRLSWWNAEGKFDPISSAELPDWAVLDVVEACARSNFFSVQEAAAMIRVLAESIESRSESPSHP